MTEEQWRTCAHPLDMLAFLDARAGERPLRLFHCACCRRLWPLLHPFSRDAVVVAEEYADGVAGRVEIEAVRAAAFDVQTAAFDAWVASGYRAGSTPRYYAAYLAYLATVEMILSTGSAYGVCAAATAAVPPDEEFVVGTVADVYSDPAGKTEAAAQADLLRDLFAPFRRTRAVTGWLAWNDRCVARLASAIYRDRAFDRLPVLADALEEAGCADDDLLTHCRSSGPHVRGCWAIDLLVGRQ